MKYCVFSCGVLYEYFGPGGLGQAQMSKSSGVDAEGVYLLNVRQCAAGIPARFQDGCPIMISMISLRDLARAVVAALGLQSWPHEFRVRGDRMCLNQLVEAASIMRGRHT